MSRTNRESKYVIRSRDSKMANIIKNEVSSRVKKVEESKNEDTSQSKIKKTSKGIADTQQSKEDVIVGNREETKEPILEKKLSAEIKDKVPISQPLDEKKQTKQERAFEIRNRLQILTQGRKDTIGSLTKKQSEPTISEPIHVPDVKVKSSFYEEKKIDSQSESESDSESDSQSESESDSEPIYKNYKKDERKDERRDERRDERKDERRDESDYDEKSGDEEEIHLFENVPRSAFLKLIRKAGAPSVSSDAADEIRDIMQDFILNMFDVLAQETDTFTIETIKRYMEGYIREESELSPQVVLSRSDFEKAVIQLCEKEKVKMKRETVYVIQMHVETIMMKIVEGGMLIAENSRRQRVLDKDLATSYKIYIL
jgi:histone H3/H4